MHNIDTDVHVLENSTLKARHGCRFVTFLMTALFLSVGAHAAQKDLQKLTVGYTPIAGAAMPFFNAVEEKIFQKYGFEVSPVFMGGSPLINSAILAGEFPIGYTGGARSSQAAWRGVI
jgi:ABC-type nitrate/sulfonate/bicarbonate transport system substrate-binding protein